MSADNCTVLPHYLETRGIYLEIRALTANDFDELMLLYRLEKWPASDAQVRASCTEYEYKSTLGAFTADGLLVCCCVCIPCSDDLGFIPWFLTRKDYRNRGIGAHVFSTILKLSSNRSTYLLATWQAVPFYQKHGFQDMDNAIYELNLDPGKRIAEEKNCSRTMSFQLNEKVDFRDILEYEKSVSKLDRSRYYAAFWEVDKSIRFIAVAYIDGVSCGFLALCESAYSSDVMVNLLFNADTVDVADALLQEAHRHLGDGFHCRFLITSKNVTNIGHLSRRYGIDVDDMIRTTLNPLCVMCCRGPVDDDIVDYEKVYALPSHGIHLF